MSGPPNIAILADPRMPCRSPYCECDQGKCSHGEEWYDARSEPWPPEPEEMHVRNVLMTINGHESVIRENNRLLSVGGQAYVEWNARHPSECIIDGQLNAMQLAAIAWWMIHKGPKPKE